MLIAQISDLHIVLEPARAYGEVDTVSLMREAVAKLNRLTPQPDLVIATGDLVDHGSPQEYELVRSLLSQIKAPVIVVMGNHDERNALRTGLAGFGEFPESGFIQYVHESRPVRVIVTDTTRSDSHKADFCAERAQWLDERLAEAPDVPTIVALHHPPFDTGIAWMDGKGEAWAAPLVNVLARHEQVVRVICGHMHRPIFTELAGCPVSVCPSTAHQVALDLAPQLDLEHPPFFEMEPAGFQLHSWDGRRLRTHTAHIGEWHRFAPFSKEVFENLLKAREGDGSSGPRKIMF